MAKKTDDNKPPDVEVFFDGRDCGYWFQVGNRYLKLGAKDVRMHLRTRGLRDDLYFKGLREIDYPLWQAQMTRIIDYAGPLAGYRMGLHKLSSGQSLLVTDEPRGIWDDLPKGKAKPPVWFLDFIGELLPGDQGSYFLHWLKIALESLRNGDFKPGQVLFFVGESECGKSLNQSFITEILGGRSSNPFRYMMGESQFNVDLAWTEHWQIEDPASTTDLRTRRMFGAKLKECIVNDKFSIHQKGKDALLMRLARRVTVSVNREAENLSVAPPMDDSIKDKAMLFACNRVTKALEQFKGPKGELDRKKLWEFFLALVPQIRHWLLTRLGDIPQELRNVRFGITAYHHPELLAELAGLSAESRLLQILDAVFFPEADADKEPMASYDQPQEFKALDLERKLRNSDLSFEVDKLLKYHGACGAYLGRLAKQYPERFSSRKLHGTTIWRLKPPCATKDEQQ